MNCPVIANATRHITMQSSHSYGIKFKAGDRVQVGGKSGTIKRVVYDMWGAPPDYEVEFDFSDPTNTINIFPEHAITPLTRPNGEVQQNWAANLATPQPHMSKCECGVDTVGAGLHSTWCPKHLRENV